jgi:two-component system cell cycle sensor histidine kinase/response regulator CckA
VLDWVAETLGLAVLREGERGEVQCNRAAQTLLGAPTCPSLVMALEQVLGPELRGSALLDALARARRGERVELLGRDDARALLSAHRPGRAQLVVARGAAAAARNADLAANVSHELANALGAIAGWARLAREGERVGEALELIEKSADSAWHAARKLLDDVGGTRRRTAEVIDLSTFVEDAAKLLAPKAAAKSVEVKTRVEPGVRIRGDRGAAWSIVWNLAANAVEALSRGGTVELRLSARGDHALLAVEDDGPGMSPEQRLRAFEPYFTTKPSGTGLGLALVKRAVGELEGEIELHTHVGLGTRFNITFPLAVGQAQPGRRNAGAKRSSGVYYAETLSGRILVVDDDPSLREMIAAALAMRGAEVVAVGSPEAALAEPGPFAVAVVDLRLPELTGDVLAARLRAAGTVHRVLLITGMEPPEHFAPGGEPNAVLRKPFELEDLFEQLTHLLPSRPSQSAAG